MLTTFDEDENVYAAIRAGASGFLLKDVTPDRAARRDQVGGRRRRGHRPGRDPAAAGRARPAPRRPRPPSAALAELTPREREVLVLVAQGLSNAEISGRLFLSPATTKTHVSRILTKLAARDRAQLVALAYETGLVVPGGTG